MVWPFSSSASAPTPTELSTSDIPAQCPMSEKISKCPVDHSKVSAAELRTDNFIPVALSATALSDQKIPLDSSRTTSTIPRAAGTAEPVAEEGCKANITSNESNNWIYPSHQQFFNALKRKGFETNEEDVPMIVHIHNEMNEKCWQEIVRWEQLATNDMNTMPKLKKFQGRPHDLTPKAFVLTSLGLSPKPFDRHDWVVDRDGREVRYVIDFYPSEVGSSTDSTISEAVMNVDVRPAIEDVSSAMLRLRAAFH